MSESIPRGLWDHSWALGGVGEKEYFHGASTLKFLTLWTKLLLSKNITMVPKRVVKET